MSDSLLRTKMLTFCEKAFAQKINAKAKANMFRSDSDIPIKRKDTKNRVLQ